MLHVEGAPALESMTGGHAFLVKDSAAQRKKRKPKGGAVKIKVSYENGSENNFSIYCNETLALELVERLMRIKGYVGKVEIIK